MSNQIHSTSFITREIRRSIYLIVFVFAIVATIGYFHTGVSSWKMTHWMFNWEHGFVKRGLVGTIVFGAFDVVTSRTLRIIQLSLAVIMVAALFALLVRTLDSGLRETESDHLFKLKMAVIAAFILLSPGIIPQVFQDLGRFDVIGLLILVTIVSLVPKLGRWTGLGICLLGSFIAILVHEAFALWVAPIAIAFWYDRWRAEKYSAILIIPALILTVIVTSIVWRFTYERLFDFDTAMALLQRQADFDIVESSLMVHYRTVVDNVVNNAENALSARRIAGLVIGMALLAAKAKLLLGVLRSPKISRSKADKAILAALALAPLSLFLVAHDHGRWLAMLDANFLLLFLFAASRDGIELGKMTESMMIAMLLLMLGFVMLGPFGVTEAFPHAQIWSILAVALGAFGG